MREEMKRHTGEIAREREGKILDKIHIQDRRNEERKTMYRNEMNLERKTERTRETAEDKMIVRESIKLEERE